MPNLYGPPSPEMRSQYQSQFQTPSPSPSPSPTPGAKKGPGIEQMQLTDEEKTKMREDLISMMVKKLGAEATEESAQSMLQQVLSFTPKATPSAEGKD